MEELVVGSAAAVDEVVDVETVSSPPPSFLEKKMRGAVGSTDERPAFGSYRSRPKMAVKRTLASKSVKKKRALVPYHPQLYISADGKKLRTPPEKTKVKVRPHAKAKRASKKQRISLLSESPSASDEEDDLVVPRRSGLGDSSDRAQTDPLRQESLIEPNKLPYEDIVLQGPDYPSQDPKERVAYVIKVYDELRRLYASVEDRKRKEAEKAKKKVQKRERAELKSYNTLKSKYQVNGFESMVGSVPGVSVGDHFYYRLEMFLIGLHRQSQAGIDSIPELKSGRVNEEGHPVSLAVSVIASGGYEDDNDEGDTLIYTGQGGNLLNRNRKDVKDQELIKGNLALYNSLQLNVPVRVIRGNVRDRSQSPSGKIYYYDGLYNVTGMQKEKGLAGCSVYKFKLVRQDGQPPRLSDLVRFKGVSSPNGVPALQEKLLLDDLSGGKETIKIPVFGREQDGLPPSFRYITKCTYPPVANLKPATVCSCVGECTFECPCLAWNDGNYAYNENGAIVWSETAVYECGPGCNCRTSCNNRSSQRGIRFNLQVFKTASRGWGLRCRDFIPSGSFICEYVGEIIHTTEAETREVDDYLFDTQLIEREVGNLSKLLKKPSDEKNAGSEGTSGETRNDGANNGAPTDVRKESEWTVDAYKMGNVGRFINHSCKGNLYVQCVFQEHHDERIPHVMLFSREKIAPYTELTYDYGYVLDSVVQNGKLINRKCLCGSAGCLGKMY